LDKESLETLFYFLPLAIQLMDDDLSIENCNGITGLELADQREEYMDTVLDGRKVIATWIRAQEPVNSLRDISISSLFTLFWESRLKALDGNTPMDYRVGEAFVKIMNSVDSVHASKSSDEVAKICREARTVNAIRSTARFAVLRSSILSNPVGNRICNELVADSTGLKPQEERSDGRSLPNILCTLLTTSRSAKAGPSQHIVGRGRKRRLDHSNPAIGFPDQASPAMPPV
jgi:hypothetical protein